MIFKKMLDKCLFFSYKHRKSFIIIIIFFYKVNNTAIQGTTVKLLNAKFSVKKKNPKWRTLTYFRNAESPGCDVIISLSTCQNVDTIEHLVLWFILFGRRKNIVTWPCTRKCYILNWIKMWKHPGEYCSIVKL